MKPTRPILFLAAALTLAVTCREVPADAPPRAPVMDGSYAATGDRSLDGDSIYVTLEDRRREEVRLIGVDAPEKSMPHANDARTFLRKAIAGKQLRIVAGPEAMDAFQRRLGWVTVDGKSVNVMMIEQGFAAVYVIPPNTRWTDDLLAAQRKAYDARRGIWGVADMEEPRSFRYRNRNPGRGTRETLQYHNHVIVGDARDPRRKAHWPECIHIWRIDPRDRRPFESLRAAQDAGFTMERESR